MGESTRDIELGKNLEKAQDQKAPAKRDSKMPKEKKINPDVMVKEKFGAEPLALTERASEGQEMRTSERSAIGREEGGKKKKEKKEKKKHKKEKRHRSKQSDEEEELFEEEPLEDEPMGANDDIKDAAPGEDEQG